MKIRFEIYLHVYRCWLYGPIIWCVCVSIDIAFNLCPILLVYSLILYFVQLVLSFCHCSYGDTNKINHGRYRTFIISTFQRSDEVRATVRHSKNKVTGKEKHENRSYHNKVNKDKPKCLVVKRWFFEVFNACL